MRDAIRPGQGKEMGLRSHQKGVYCCEKISWERSESDDLMKKGGFSKQHFKKKEKTGQNCQEVNSPRNRRQGNDGKKVSV